MAESNLNEPSSTLISTYCPSAESVSELNPNRYVATVVVLTPKRALPTEEGGSAGSVPDMQCYLGQNGITTIIGQMEDGRVTIDSARTNQLKWFSNTDTPFEYGHVFPSNCEVSFHPHGIASPNYLPIGSIHRPACVYTRAGQNWIATPHHPPRSFLPHPSLVSQTPWTQIPPNPTDNLDTSLTPRVVHPYPLSMQFDNMSIDNGQITTHYTPSGFISYDQAQNPTANRQFISDPSKHSYIAAGMHTDGYSFLDPFTSGPSVHDYSIDNQSYTGNTANWYLSESNFAHRQNGETVFREIDMGDLGCATPRQNSVQYVGSCQ